MIIQVNAENVAEYREIFDLCMKGYKSDEGGHLLPTLDVDYFLKTWTHYLMLHLGTIFVLLDEAGKAVGTLGAVKYPEPNSGAMMACELFWYVLPEYRGDGMGLLREYEAWAKESGCRYASVVHLMGEMADVMKRVYERKGYIAREVHYTKEV